MIEITAGDEVPEDFKGRRPEYWIDGILTDLFFFCKVILHHGKIVEYRDLNWIHLELCDFLDPAKNPIPQMLVMMSRDSLKSSIGRGMMAQWFLQKAWQRTQGKAFIYSGVFDLAQDHLDKIVREILSNELIQAFFHGRIPAKKEDFDVCRLDEGRIRYHGIEIDVGSPEKSLTGHHYELGMVDNLANEINTQTVEMRRKMNKRWQQLESVFAENAREVVFETPWATDDVSGIILQPEGKFDYSTLRRKACFQFISDTGYAVFSCPATRGEGELGTPNFPEKMDETYLRRKRTKQGQYIYSALYDLQPIPDEEVVIRPEWWKVEYQSLPENYVRNICVDAAGTTKKSSSYSGLSIGEWDETGTLYLPYASKRKLSPMELERWILEMFDMSRDQGRPVTWIGIEKEKYGIYLKDSLQSKRKDLVIILWDNRALTRGYRHGELVPYYETRKILRGPNIKEYDDELASYYKGKETNVDIFDTIWGHFQIKLLPKRATVPRDPRIHEIEKEIAEFEGQARADRSGEDDFHREIARRF